MEELNDDETAEELAEELAAFATAGRSTTVTLARGYSRSVVKSAPSVPSSASTAPRSLAPDSCRSNAEPARIENQTNDTRLGTRIT